MAYNYREVKLASSKYSIKCPYSMDAKYIVIHNTANDASAANEIAYMQRNNNKVSFHIAVDDIEAVQGLPLNRNAWHAGDGNGDGNRKGIGIEICYSKSGGNRFETAQENAAHLTASLLSVYGWDISRVKKHQDFSGKHCPHRTLDDYGWNYFIGRVKYYMNYKEEAITMRYFELLDGMNIRKTPNGTKVGVVPKGTIISGTEFGTSGSTTWLKTTYNGISGYVCVLPASKGYAKEVSAPADDYKALYETEKAKTNALQKKIDEIKVICNR